MGSGFDILTVLDCGPTNLPALSKRFLVRFWYHDLGRVVTPISSVLPGMAKRVETDHDPQPAVRGLTMIV